MRLPERDQAVVAHKKRPPEGSPCDHHRYQRRSTTATSSGVVSFNTWLVPPMSSSTTSVFHRYYDGPQTGPAFREQPSPWTRTPLPQVGCPVTSTVVGVDQVTYTLAALLEDAAPAPAS